MTRSRVVLLLGCLAAGVVGGVVSARAGDYGQAVFNVAVMTALGLVFAFSRGEWVVSQTDEADERQRSIAEQSGLYAYYAVIAVALVGVVGELSRDEPGAFTLIAAVGGITNMVSLAVLRRLR